MPNSKGEAGCLLAVFPDCGFKGTLMHCSCCVKRVLFTSIGRVRVFYHSLGERPTNPFSCPSPVLADYFLPPCSLQQRWARLKLITFSLWSRALAASILCYRPKLASLLR